MSEDVTPAEKPRPAVLLEQWEMDLAMADQAVRQLTEQLERAVKRLEYMREIHAILEKDAGNAE